MNNSNPNPNPNPQITSTTTNADDDELLKQAILISKAVVFPMVLKSAIELNIIELLTRAGPDTFLSPAQIALEIGATARNPHAPMLLDRMLNMLASHSILKCSVSTDEDGVVKRVYGVNPICRFFIEDEDGGSLAPLLLLHHDKVFMNSWYHLNDAIMEGGVPFDREYGMHAFEYPATDPRFNQVFNKAMSSNTNMRMKKLLTVYKGFEGVKVLVDVGGGVGASLAIITSKYPDIKGINFDLPHVVAVAPPYPGVQHISGDMFSEVPKGDAIFMKLILHDWSDEKCMKLLNNCYTALPSSGKVIVMESILPEVPDDSVDTKTVCRQDLFMMVQNPGGKERRFTEYDALAKGAGFTECKAICNVYGSWIMEFVKSG